MRLLMSIEHLTEGQTTGHTTQSANWTVWATGQSAACLAAWMKGWVYASCLFVGTHYAAVARQAVCAVTAVILEK